MLMMTAAPKMTREPIMATFRKFLAEAIPWGLPPDIKYIIPDTIIAIAAKMPPSIYKKPPNDSAKERMESMVISIPLGMGIDWGPGPGGGGMGAGGGGIGGGPGGGMGGGGTGGGGTGGGGKGGGGGTGGGDIIVLKKLTWVDLA